jgi:beta-lactamase regulating signal transducer with metallopeptidase domain
MTMLVEWLWQGIVVALVTGALLACARRLNAATRYVAWWIALLAVLVVPFVPSLADFAAEQPLAASASVTLAAPAAIRLPNAPGWILSIAIGVWIGTVLVALLRMALAARALADLQRRSRPFPAGSRHLPLWSAVAARADAPTLRLSRDVRGACAVGFGRPAILVGEAVADGLTDAQLDQVLMHEYAHLARRDAWAYLCERLIVAVAGLHPAVRFIAGRIDLEREAACDDQVVALTGSVRPYASCLAEVAAIARLAGTRRNDAVAPAAAVRAPSALRARVLRLLDARRNRSARIGAGTTLTSAAVTLGVVLAAAHVPPLVVFLEAEGRAPARAVVSGVLAAGELVSEARVYPTDSVPAVISSTPRTAGRTRVRTTSPASMMTPPLTAALRSGSDDGMEPARQPDAIPPTPPLTARVLDLGVGSAPGAVTSTPVVPPPAGRVTGASAPSTSGVWAVTGQRAAAAGTAVGTGARKAGTSVAGFFARAGKAFGQSF